MAYRNDVEALEARLRSLDAELVRQTRERDAAAHLLAEARDRADHEASRFGATVREAARRRRRRRITGLGALGAVIVSIWAVTLPGHPDRRPEYRRQVERTHRLLDGYQASVHELCRCDDEPCARQRELETRWQYGPPFGDMFSVGLDADGERRLDQIWGQYCTCVFRAPWSRSDDRAPR